MRNPGESQSGHLKNALLADWNDKTEFQERVQSLDKNKPVYSYCLSGAGSNEAAEWLRQNGFKAYNLSGGIAAWKNADRTVDMAKTVKQITLEEYMSTIPNDKTVLVDFSAVWCPPCKKMEPIIDSLAAANKAQIVFVK